MKTPVGLVTVALAVAILLLATLVIAASTRGEVGDLAVRMHSPAAIMEPAAQVQR